MAKERPVPSGDRNPATARDRQAAPAGPQHSPRAPGQRRQFAGGPSDPRPIPAPFMQNIPPVPTSAPTPYPADAERTANPMQPGLGGDSAGAATQAGAGHPGSAAQVAARYPHLRGAPLQGPSTRERAMGRRPQTRRADHTPGLPMPGRPVPASPSTFAPHPYLAESASDFAEAPTEPLSVPTAGSGPASLVGPIGGSELTFTAAPERPADEAYDPDQTGEFGVVQPIQPTVAVPTQSTGRTSAASVLAGAAAARPRKPQRAPRPGNQRFPSQPATRRPAPARPMMPGLQLQPMVHVTDMAAAVAFYEGLGGEVNHGDRDGDWVLMQVGVSQIGLVSRPADAERGESVVELNFSATMPLDRLEQLLREHGIAIVRAAPDPDLGVQLHVETPDGMPIKIHQVEPDLLV